jgi:NCS1 family nucleobase:cation symporter-1
MILVIIPMLPALANKVTPNNVHIPKELSNLFAINWLYGFVASCVLYSVLNLVFPEKRTLIACVVQEDTEVVEGVIASDESTDGNSGRAEKGLHLKGRDVEVKS